MPSDAVRDDVRRSRPGRLSGSRSPEPRASDHARADAGPEPGLRPRASVNPVLGLKAENQDLRNRLRAAAADAEDASRLRDLRLREVEALARSLEVRLARREAQLEKTWESFSWRVTRPLRSARRLAAKTLSLFKQAASLLYRAAPLPAVAKRLLLDALFRGAPALFRESNTYRAWAATRGAPVPREVAIPADQAASIAVPLDFSAVPARPRLAVLCHVYHESVAPELAAYLRNVRFPFDLFVTTDSEAKTAFIAEAFGEMLTAVRLVPNRGRDVAAKLLGFPEVYDSHEFVLHLHTKRSAHTDTLAAWRGFLFETLLGSESIVDSVFTIFAARPDVGIVAAQHFEPLRHWINWGGNFPAARALAGRMGFALTEDGALDFPAGSMFWARSAALKPLLGLGLTFDSFDAEGGQQDGTLAHAVERLYFHACEHAGLAWVRIAHPPLLAATPAITTLRARDELDRFLAGSLDRLLGPDAPAPRRAAGKPLPPAPALIARLQDRALGIGQRDAVPVTIGVAGPDDAALRRAVARASRTLAQIGAEGRVAVRAGDFALAHNSMMAEAFEGGAEIYIAAAADGVFHPDAVGDLLRMTLAHEGRALIEPAPFPAAHPKGYCPITLETPWAADACVVIPRRVYERLGGFDESLRGPCAVIDFSWRARANGFTVRVCPTALFLRPVALREREPLEAALCAGLVLARKWGNAEAEARLAQSLRTLGAQAPAQTRAAIPASWRRVADFTGPTALLWSGA